MPRRPALAAAFGLGLLSALALPPVHAIPVLLLAVPGLLALLGAATSWRRAAGLGLAWGFGHNLGGLYWVTEALLTDPARWWWLVPLAAPALAAAMALYAVPPALAAWSLPPGWRRLAGFAGAWTLAEMLRGVLLTGFPWNPLGGVWAFAALPVQGAAVVGVHGLSLLTLLLAGLPALPDRRRAWLAGGTAALALAAFGAWRLSGPEPPGPPVRLVLVQAGVAQAEKWREDRRAAILRRYLDLTADAAARAAAGAPPGAALVVVWPETATQFLLAQDPDARRLAAGALPSGAARALLLAGTVRVDWGADGRPARLWNSLVALDAAGEVRAVYDKSRLVPFGEYMPLGGLLPIRIAAGGMDFGAGPGPVALAAPGLPPFGALICYEVIFPGAVAPAPRPAWLVNVTNDAWFGRSAGPWQHLAAARLRAVEEGLPLARAAQTGISAVFDARGRRLAALGIGETGTLAADLPAAGAPTPFARLGQAVPAALALATLGLACLRRRGRDGPAAGSDRAAPGSRRRWREGSPPPQGETMP
ncbi:apolipoprotein N-acyltransferase [Roseicella aerolata]|uniref:apolipoprotein N-acyltransferase n=1 Tax=Roseicella aerolata TaxID=2883479 RepID=UPI0021F5B870|nr:apolipoprotein N-acyltransferase [Roseicella aerolata]